MFSAERKIMIFSWYVILYMQVMLFLPWFHRKVSGYQLQKTICFVLAVLVSIKLFAVLLHFCGLKYTFLYSAFNRIFFRYLPIVICGYLSAKYNLVEKMGQYFSVWSVGKKIFCCLVL